MQISIHENTLTISLRDKPASLYRKIQYECPVDVDKFGAVIGIEVEGPRHNFGEAALQGFELINLTEHDHDNIHTSEGRRLIPHAQQRPPSSTIKPPWISYDSKYDMMYINPTVGLTQPSYHTSIPISCTFYFDAGNKLCRVDVPLREIEKEFRESG